MLNIVISGAPGSGKGTQSDLIVKKYELVHLSTGDILRAEIAKGSEIGKIAENLIAQGAFVPDDVIIDMLDNVINQYPTAKGFIFDGFPRTVVQAEALDSMLRKRNMKVDIMLNVDVPSNELVKRLMLRGQTSGRSDDNMVTVQNRIRTFEEKTLPVMQFYDRQGKHHRIKGDKSVEEVFADICAAIDRVK